jgi:transcriptional regulator with XRE-family HTH domain
VGQEGGVKTEKEPLQNSFKSNDGSSCLPICTILWYIESMRLLHSKVIDLCRERGLTVSDALDQAAVSRNAYYSLVRKPSLLPASLEALAEALGVRLSELLEDRPSAVDKAKEMALEVESIVRKHRGADPDNVRHTLLLLDEEPISRLRRALRRGRRSHFQS